MKVVNSACTALLPAGVAVADSAIAHVSYKTHPLRESVSGRWAFFTASRANEPGHKSLGILGFMPAPDGFARNDFGCQLGELGWAIGQNLRIEPA